MEKIKESAQYIKSKLQNMKPEIAIILGSGLGALPEDYDCSIIPYADIPNFQKSSIEGHKGQLCFCEIEGKQVIMMQGRFHYYEGYSMEQITFPIKVFKLLGITKIILTNAAGSLDKNIKVGDIMVITDHINMMGNNPLIGQNHDELGVRFPDMSDIYKKDLINIIDKSALETNIDIKKGIYMAMTGPSYETPAEVKMAKHLGANAVGMSTVPEAIVANYCGINVIGLSCITNYAAGVSDKKLSHNEVIEATKNIETKFKTLIKSIIRNL